MAKTILRSGAALGASIAAIAGVGVAASPNAAAATITHKYHWTVAYYPAHTVYRYTSKLPKGVHRTTVAGVTGVRSWLFWETLSNGRVVRKQVAGGKVLRAPRWKIVLIGTRKASSVYSTTPAHGVTCSASYYDTGQITASGEYFNPNGMTAAHRTLPLGTRIKVSHNGRTVIVRINDRGPYVSGRCLDLSRGAFAALGSLSSGTMTVTYQVI